MTTKHLIVKNKSYYFYNNLINLSNCSMNNLKLDKKSWKDIDIYYIGYFDKNKPEDWCVNSVNPLYLIINKVFCFVREKDGVKYLTIDKGNKKLEDFILSLWNKVFSSIKYNIKKINHECKSLDECKGFPDCEEFGKIEVDYDEDFGKIRFVGNDNLPLRKLIYFQTTTVVISCVFKQGDLFYPQVYLDDALYQL